MSSQQLSGKTAIVTGASAGIGEAIAVMMAERGASVALCGRNEVRLQTALEKCVQASGGHSEWFLAVAGDILLSTVRKDTLEKTVEKFGKLDILVNNAGILFRDIGTSTVTEEEWDKMMDTNLKSVFFFTQAAVPFLEKTKGNVVNISSVASTCVRVGVSIYSVSKAALDHMTRCLALDIGPKGIRVNSVAPSYIPETEITRNVFTGSTSTEMMDAATKAMENAILNQPMGELGTKEQVAEIVLFLASEAASFVTGQHMFATGGSQLINSLPPNT